MRGIRRAAGLLLLVYPCCAQQISSRALIIAVQPSEGTYSVAMPAAEARPIVTARAAARIDGAWVRSGDYPQHRVAETPFQDVLGSGKQIRVTCSGLNDRPDLAYSLQIYDERPYGAVQVELQNHTSRAVTVQSLRSAESARVDLGGPDSADRVLSDSYSEDWPRLVIYDLGQATGGVHRGTGSQLIYNRKSGQSLFFGALTAGRLLTMLHLSYQGQGDNSTVTSFSVDSTGTTEVQKDEAPPAALMELSLPLPPGGSIASERVMVAAGGDYLAQLMAYGDAIRRLHSARVSADNLLGWWSWTSYYMLINEGAALTNAHWLAENLKSFGYRYFHLDEGYQYARGEYATANATQFPHGLRYVGDEVRRLGLNFGIWTGPFEVTERAEIYQKHKDWLVHTADGKPISIGVAGGQDEPMYALDTTHPAAQEYLRQTYRTMTREWGVRYIKLDFMDRTAIEGYRYRPNTTALEGLRIGLEVIRDAVGDEVLLDKDGSPMLTPVGLVDAGRISFDTRHSYIRTRAVAPGIAARFYMNRNFFVNDPDAFNLTAAAPLPPTLERQALVPVSLEEAQVAIALSAVSGGLYEIGDDLPRLARDPERLALARNRDLLAMAKISKSSIPTDLLTYSREDEQPSVFFLREEPRQSILTVFNWTDQPRSRTLRLADFGLQGAGNWSAYDILNGSARVPVKGAEIRISDQKPHSVRMLKIIDERIPAAAPLLRADVPSAAGLMSVFRVSAEAEAGGPPALDYRWDFGDGVTAQGRTASHAYTMNGDYTIELTAEGLDGIPARRSFRIAVTGTIGPEADWKLNRRFVEPAGRHAR